MLSRYLRAFMQSPGGVLEMPAAMDIIASSGTQINTTLAATTIESGDSFTVKNAALSSDAWLVQAWAYNQVAGMMRVRSAKLHDNVDAIRARVQASIVQPLLPTGVMQKLWPQDTLIVELAGSNVAGDIEFVVLQLYYADLPGQAGRFQTADYVKGRMKNLVGVRSQITLLTSGAYGTAKALNADADLLKANTDYAVLGMTTDKRVAGIFLRGPDTGNLRVGVPGELTPIEDFSCWFRNLGLSYNLPLIPVINSANKGATLIDCLADKNGGTANITVWLAELG